MANNGLRAAAGRVIKKTSKQSAGGMSGALTLIVSVTSNLATRTFSQSP